eukprot:3058013-Pyramimonas_sp.AAC.1
MSALSCKAGDKRGGYYYAEIAKRLEHAARAPDANIHQEAQQQHPAVRRWEKKLDTEFAKL